MTTRTLLAIALMLLPPALPAWSQTLSTTDQAPGQHQAVGEQATEARRTPSGETKIFDDLVIPEGEVRAGAIRVIGGNLTVAGRVTGRITVLGGDVDILPTAEIEGTIATIGGRIRRSPEARVTGQVLEINRGKVSLSREENREIFGYDDRKDELLDRHDDEENWQSRRVDRHKIPSWRQRGSRPSREDFEVFEDVTVRYNRAEGLAAYFPFNPDTDDIPGFKVFGYVGRAFGARKWYGRLGVGEYLWRGRIGFLLEGHREARQDDGWRVSPNENSLSAIFINRDWYDWYEAEGYSGALVLALPDLVEFRARYRDETHAGMGVVTNWSLLGRNRTFRSAFGITPGRDITLQYRLRAGGPVGDFPGRFQANAAYTYTETMPDGAFSYRREDISLEAFVPLHRRLGIRLGTRSGTITGNNYGLQHQVAIGGIGSVQGFAYKDLDGDETIDSGNHYASVRTAFSLRDGNKLYSLMGHVGRVWDSTEPLLSAQHLTDITTGSSAAFGLAYTDGNVRWEIFKPLTAGNDWIIYFRILNF